MVIGDKAEDAFRQSMIFSQGSLSIFWSNSLVTSLMLIGLALLLLHPLQLAWRGARRLTAARATQG
jgi:TctA family transporter